MFAMAKVTKEFQFKVMIEQDADGWYTASVPELEGCYTQGKTLEEARSRIKEAIQLVLETDKAAAALKKQQPKAASRFFGIEDICIRYA